jgi:hypothetical protein
MDGEIVLSTDINGNKICKFEDNDISVTIVLKKDYSDVESKIRYSNILKDIEKILETTTAMDEFKELVDSYGYLYVDRIED